MERLLRMKVERDHLDRSTDVDALALDGRRRRARKPLREHLGLIAGGFVALAGVLEPLLQFNVLPHGRPVAIVVLVVLSVAFMIGSARMVRRWL